jgi:hypothetical protein
MPYRRFPTFLLFCTLAIAFLLMGCARKQVPTVVEGAAGSYVVPTVASAFEIQPTIPPRSTPPSSIDPSVFIAPTPNSTMISQVTAAALNEDKLKEVVVYDDSLRSDWSISHSFESDIDTFSKKYVYQGAYSIQVRPKFTTGTLYFTLNQTAGEPILRSRVQAIRLYLSGGDLPVNNDAIAMAVTGSNQYPYWVENDRSVKLDGRVTDNQPLFSETRLYYLDINAAIPAKTFIKVTNWLDSRTYDPSYTYLTGFYLKTDRASVPAFYVDKVSILLLPKAR